MIFQTYLFNISVVNTSLFTPVAYRVWAGLEPLQFTNLFPIWTDRDDIAELSIRVSI
jgi:hypothetical protein